MSRSILVEPIDGAAHRVRVRGRLDDVRVWRCRGCRRYRPWADGAADDMPEHCHACWAAAHIDDPEEGA